ncbi:FAD dependent oxidoreductase [Gonapodya prolifera JEL478]|uniref:FAD dependent oxidoreductase n=1 Tax=Gonapodya prolifera (strain JEL478) TaxID=1344416 RepID=A0A139AYV3_GONPJ|nr:FAD dependent oxidoreductase [Gonapodya prolifera JEL478]|eukprot:KXS21884.1 FAD dependent oxidoreductase [Gonapodya prolifera JEL478]
MAAAPSPSSSASLSPDPLNVVVVGGGAIGVATAYYLVTHPKAQEKNIQVTLIERSGIAAAASGKAQLLQFGKGKAGAGGFLASDWSDHTPYASLSRLSFSLHAHLASILGGDVTYGYRPMRALAVEAGEGRKAGGGKKGRAAGGKSGKDGGEREGEDEEKRNRPDEWVDGDVIGRWEEIGTPTTCAQLHPFCFLHTLFDAALATGRLRLLMGYDARGIRYDDGEVVAATDAVPPSGGWLAWLTGTPVSPAPVAAGGGEENDPAGGMRRSRSRTSSGKKPRATGVLVRASGEVPPTTSQGSLDEGAVGSGAQLSLQPDTSPADDTTCPHAPPAPSRAHSHPHVRMPTPSYHIPGSGTSRADPGEESVVPADVVVLATGAWAGEAGGWLPGAVRWPKIAYGHRSHSIILRPKDPVSPTALFVTYRNPPHSIDPEIFPRPDGNVYVCGASDDVVLPSSAALCAPDPASCELLRGVAGKLSTALDGAVEHKTQACWVPRVGDRPLIGWVGGVEGVAVGTGHTVWGILNSPATGKVLSELIVDGEVTCLDSSGFMEKGGKMWSKGW